MRLIKSLTMKNIVLFKILFFCFVLVHAQEYQIDKPATFKGKPSNIDEFVQSNLQYPNEEWWDCKQGTVIIEGIVTVDGSFIELSIAESVTPLMDIEALRIADLMQSWKPAKLKRNAVNSKVRIKIDFFLSQNEIEQIEIFKKHGLDEKMPLFVLDGKVVNGRLAIESYNVKSVRVLKGKNAVDKYGEIGENGVIEIESKRGTPPLF